MTTIEYKRVVIAPCQFAGIGIQVYIQGEHGCRRYYPTYQSLKRLQDIVDKHIGKLYADLMTSTIEFTVRQRKGQP